MPTLMGYDADHPRAAWRGGSRGVSVSTLDDMETLSSPRYRSIR
jgi:methylmalonyl-CoA mutase N-terminal domain/subunit